MKLTTFKPVSGRVLMKPRSLVPLVILGGIAVQAYGFQQYQIWALPEAPGDASRAMALVEMGSGNDRIIIGGQVRVDNRWLPAVWIDGADIDPVILQHLGFGGRVNTLSGANGDDVWFAAGMVLDEQGRRRPALWRAGSPDVELLPFVFADGSVRSILINGPLSVVGTAITQAGLRRAVVWEGTPNNFTLIELPSDPRFREAAGNDIGIAPNGELVVVGYSYELRNVCGLWRRTGGEWQPPVWLPNLPNGNRAAALCMNEPVNEGVIRIAGEAETGAGDTHPALWVPEEGGGWSITDLGLPPGMASGRVNSLLLPAVQQLLAVGEGSDETGSSVAMMWKVEEGERVVAYDLNSLIVNPTELTLRSANSILQAWDAATTGVVGDATSPDGESHAYLLAEVTCDPCDINCDGQVNAFDIRPFLEILFEGGVPCDDCTGDTNGDGTINAFDIRPFLDCLFP